MARFELPPLGRADPCRRVARAQAFEIGHEFESLGEMVAIWLGDEHAAMRAQLGKSDRCQPAQRFANRRARQAEALGDIAFIEPRTRRQLSGDDLVGQMLARAVGPGLGRGGRDRAARGFWHGVCLNQNRDCVQSR